MHNMQLPVLNNIHCFDKELGHLLPAGARAAAANPIMPSYKTITIIGGYNAIYAVV